MNAACKNVAGLAMLCVFDWLHVFKIVWVQKQFILRPLVLPPVC